jgi:hypothetical protein
MKYRVVRSLTAKDHRRLTREELYNLVWAKPMTEVGHDFGISDRAMAEVCARIQVPVPTRGYWAKKTEGKSVAKLPLPEFVVKAPKESKGGVTPARQTAEKRSFGSVFEQRNQTIKKALREFRKPLSEASIKPIRGHYAAGKAKKAEFPFDRHTPELGYVVVDPSHRGNRPSSRMTEALVKDAASLFATTSEPNMKSALKGAGFAQRGIEWRGRGGGRISLWIRHRAE